MAVDQSLLEIKRPKTFEEASKSYDVAAAGAAERRLTAESASRPAEPASRVVGLEASSGLIFSHKFMQTLRDDSTHVLAMTVVQFIETLRRLSVDVESAKVGAAAGAVSAARL